MITIEKMLREGQTLTCRFSETYTPEFFDLLYERDAMAINDILSLPGIQVFDTIHSQLKELIKTRNPSQTYTCEALEDKIKEYLSDAPEYGYGVWVYYSWSNKLVHILPEHEFTEMRTNRNKYKITDEEREILACKKIGVIGLSVGQSVSLTMAMERTFGELRIADFDELEITNLNRLRSGVHNMGIKKTVLVAREILEIDPYLKVTCFHEGIDNDNLEQFLLENGKLDILIDECDSVDVKINCRKEARKHGIPVLMEASDRGTVDIERFDLDPSYPLLHGHIENLDVSKLSGLQTNEEKLPYILPFIGIDNMSPRFKASSIEIGQTISTWPQLASAVAMGGGITADVCRRILLDQLHISGRYFVDVEEIFKDQSIDIAPELSEANHVVLTINDMQAYSDRIRIKDAVFFIPDIDVINKVIDAARIAPSAGNNQPWRWFYDKGRLLLFNSKAGAGQIYDLAAYLSLGAAIENVRLKAGELGLKCEVQLFPLSDSRNDELIAVASFSPLESIKKDSLVNMISSRYTNRNLGNKITIPQLHIKEITTASEVAENVKLSIITDSGKIERLSVIIGKAEKLRIFVEQGHKEFFESEIRWTRENAENSKDGIDLRTVDLSLKDIVGLKLLKDPKTVKLLSEWNAGKAIEKQSRDLISTSSGIAILTIPSLSKELSLHAGMSMERVWLAANDAGIAVQPFFAPILHFALVRHNLGHTLPTQVCKQFETLYSEFVDVCGLKPTEELVFLFRFCYADDVKVQSMRLDKDDIFFISKNK